MTLTLSDSGLIDTIVRDYQAIFDRAPDAGGLAYYVGQVDSGVLNYATVEASLVASDEFARDHTNQDVGGILIQTYQNVVGRLPDAGGLAYYETQISDGALTVAGAIHAIANSAEAVAHNINGVFRVDTDIANGLPIPVGPLDNSPLQTIVTVTVPGPTTNIAPPDNVSFVNDGALPTSEQIAGGAPWGSGNAATGYTSMVDNTSGITISNAFHDRGIADSYAPTSVTQIGTAVTANYNLPGGAQVGSPTHSAINFDFVIGGGPNQLANGNYQVTAEITSNTGVVTDLHLVASTAGDKWIIDAGPGAPAGTVVANDDNSPNGLALNGTVASNSENFAFAFLGANANPHGNWTIETDVVNTVGHHTVASLTDVLHFS